MSRQERLSRCERLGMRLDLILRKRVLAGIAAVAMGASLVFTGSASAHDMDREQARQKADEYARTVVKERNYAAYTLIQCKKLYPHRVECSLGYQHAPDIRAREYTCVEHIMVYFMPHNGSRRDWTYYMTHGGGDGKKCGSRYLSGPNP